MSTMKKPKLGIQNAEIPEHVILNKILPRLPVKSLLRFKTVSKTWLSSISNPAFHKSHLQFSSSAPKFLLSHVSSFDCKRFLLSYDESKTIVRDLVQLDSNILNQQSGTFYQLGSCNGVMCWYHDDGTLETFTLWNPATRHCKSTMFYAEDMNVASYGFGYVSTTDDYKILAMYLGPSTSTQEFGRFEMFSLKTGGWTSLDNLDEMNYAGSLDDNCAVYMDETLYWPFRNQDTQTLVGIIGFNLVTDEMNEVQQISWLSNYSSVERIFKIQGCLSLYCSKGRDFDSDMWMLKKQDGLETWSKLFSIDCRITPIDFTENGKYLVQHSGQLKLIDPEEQDTDHSADGVDCDDQILVTGRKYVESLVTL